MMTTLEDVEKAMKDVDEHYEWIVDPVPASVQVLLRTLKKYILDQQLFGPNSDNDNDRHDDNNIFASLGSLVSTYQKADSGSSGSSVLCTSDLGLSPQALDVEFEGRHFSVMSCFQAHKCYYRMPQSIKSNHKTTQDVQKFSEYTLAEATAAGAQIDLDVALWDANRDGLMRDLCEKAFEQNLDAKKRLMKAQGEIVEDTLPDRYWGNTKGMNKYGELLMMLRDTFLANATKRNGKRKVGDLADLGDLADTL